MKHWGKPMAVVLASAFTLSTFIVSPSDALGQVQSQTHLDELVKLRTAAVANAEDPQSNKAIAKEYEFDSTATPWFPSAYPLHKGCELVSYVFCNWKPKNAANHSGLSQWLEVRVDPVSTKLISTKPLDWTIDYPKCSASQTLTPQEHFAKKVMYRKVIDVLVAASEGAAISQSDAADVRSYYSNFLNSRKALAENLEHSQPTFYAWVQQTSTVLRAAK